MRAIAHIVPHMRNPLHLARAASALITLVRDPSRLEKVFELRDAVASKEALAFLADHFDRDELGREALRTRPRLGAIDLARLASFPDGSLAREFALHMRRAGLDPAAIPTLPSPDRLSFVSAHLYETHDVWHVVTGFGVDVAGELGLQAFQVGQFPARLSMVILAGGIMNTTLYAVDDRARRFEAIARGWDLGRDAKPFFGVRWGELWGEPLVEVRERLGIPRGGVTLRAS